MKTNTSRQSGFTLLELMVVVAIVGILSSVALTAYSDYVKRARMVELAQQFAQMKTILAIYSQELGKYPDDTHIVPPEGAALPEFWSETTLLGGNFNWEGPDRYPYAGIAILGATAPEEDIAMFDRLIDNGDLNTGKFRISEVNSRHVFILEE